MKIHITGVAGLIGSHLAKYFLTHGDEVTGSDNLSSGYRDNIPLQVKLFAVDCKNLNEMVRAVRGSEVIYHCAANPHE